MIPKGGNRFSDKIMLKQAEHCGFGRKIRFTPGSHAVSCVQRGGVMSERKNTSARAALCRAICVLLLAASTAACDACGNFDPVRLQAGQQPGACRDAPKLR
jgi:hypothetical protein